MNILVTGGLGYLGSHAVTQLSEAGNEVVVVDNLSNSSDMVLEKINRIIKKDINFFKTDIRNIEEIEQILNQYRINSVVHFAGLKSVRKSEIEKKEYFDVNVNGTKALVNVMEKNIKGDKYFVFSSSACVYGKPEYLPYDEKHPLSPENYYGETKLEVERYLKEIYQQQDKWNVAILRYFNPIGAHASSIIGESPIGNPENLMPNILNSASNKKILEIFGSDHETEDGTAVRDFIHVTDLIDGHKDALDFLINQPKDVFDIFNLGTGFGNSVLEIIKAFESVNNTEVNFKFSEKRIGDLPIYFAEAKKAKKLLNWEAKLSISDMCKSSWEFYKNYK